MSNFSKRGGKKYKEVKKDEFDQKIIDLARVTRVMAGGKRMRFRAAVAIGDHKGRVSFAVAKGADVTVAVNKAVVKAKKELFTVKLVNGTIPHNLIAKYCAAQVLLKPAPAGRGLIAGGPVRTILELAGVKNVVTKMQGSKNKISNVRAVLEGLKRLQNK